MDMKNAAQVIRDRVDMEQILNLYGYKTKHGFMVCPFHGDKDASLKVYKGNGGWHCFGCGRGGSVIDFVMEHENCNFRTAVIAIDKNLHLNLTDEHEDPQEAEAEKRIQQWLDSFVGHVYEYCAEKRRQVEAELRTDLARIKDCEEKRETDPKHLTAQDYNFINMWDELAQYDEYRIERIDSFIKEVAAWRRKWRRAM